MTRTPRDHSALTCAILYGMTKVRAVVFALWFAAIMLWWVTFFHRIAVDGARNIALFHDIAEGGHWVEIGVIAVAVTATILGARASLRAFHYWALQKYRRDC